MRYHFNVTNTNKAILNKDSFQLGEVVYDTETGIAYCKGDDKFSFIIDQENEPCLGSKCSKRDFCYKYNLSKKFSEEDFIIRDLSVDTFQTDYGYEIYCSQDNKYRYFRWND